MLLDVIGQLNVLTKTLRIVSNVAPTIEPGQKVDLQVVSGAPDLFVTDEVVDGTLLTQIPVEIQVKWSAEGWSEEEGKMKPLEPGKDFLAPDGTAGPSAAFFFKPLFYELGAAEVLVPTPLKITAHVTLRAWLTNVDSSPREVVSKEIDPALTLSLGLLPLEIPTMLALFRIEKFRPFRKYSLDPGFVVLLVQGHCYLQALTDLANDVLTKIDTALAPLRSLAGIAAFLTRLTILRQALSAQPMVRIVHGDIENLNDLHMRVEKTLFLDQIDPDTRADDNVSALIFISAAGRVVGCYNDKKYKEGEGAFTVGVGSEMITVIPTLAISSAELGALPNVTVLKADDDDDAFNDSMTSVKFLDAPPVP